MNYIIDSYCACDWSFEGDNTGAYGQGGGEVRLPRGMTSASVPKSSD